MARVSKYQQIVQEFLEEFAQSDPNAQLIFDRDRNRYLVMHNEWRNDYRIYGCAIHLDIIEDQVWLQHNSTEIYVEHQLTQRGIPAQDIIFGFRAPSIRHRLTAALSQSN